MKIELRCCRFDHPGRHISERAVWRDDGGNLLTAIGYAPPQSDHHPVMRVKAVVDLDFIVQLIVGIM